MPDNELLLSKCFEFDWSNTKIPKIIKDVKDKEEIKKYLQSIYKYM